MTTSTQTQAGTDTQESALTLEVRTAGLTADRSVELPGEIFGAKVSIPLIHQVVVAQLAAARQGTHKTKTRGEVRGGGTKPYRQKGTGRARQGSIRAPQFAGGGIVHGPVPRDYSQRTPKKMKAAALRGALSDRARNGRIHIVDRVVIDDVPSTKQAVRLLSDITTRAHVLVVAERTDALTWKSLRNAPTVHLIAPGQLNTYDVLVSDDVVFTEGALQSFLAGTPKGKSAKARATFAGDLPGSTGGDTSSVAGDASGDVDEGGTPDEDLDTHHLDSSPSLGAPSIAPSAANEEGSK